MRSFAFLATIYAATVSSTAALVDAGERTRVDVAANGHDTKCFDGECVPENTRDGSLRSTSRWSCKGDILDSSDEEDGCCITYSFKKPQNIVKIRIAFHKGDERTRTLDVFVNGDHRSTITSNGRTLGYQNFDLYTVKTEELKLCLDDPAWNSDVWLSIKEVKILVE